MCAPLIENKEGNTTFCEFLLAERNVKDGLVKLRSVPPKFHFNLAAKLFTFSFHEKINAELLRIFNAFVSELNSELPYCFLCFSIVDCMFIFYKLNEHGVSPDYSRRRSSSLVTILGNKSFS